MRYNSTRLKFLSSTKLAVAELKEWICDLRYLAFETRMEDDDAAAESIYKDANDLEVIALHLERGQLDQAAAAYTRLVGDGKPELEIFAPTAHLLFNRLESARQVDDLFHMLG